MEALFISPEIAPLAKTGGLADVCSALPVALAKLGVKVDIILPLYRCIKEGDFSVEIVSKDLPLTFGWRNLKTNIYQTKLEKGIRVFLVKCDEFFDRSSLYGKDNGYFDNGERFIFFTKAVLAFAESFDQYWDIFHCHEWQTALVPVYLKTLSAFYHKLSSVKTVLTLHNLGYQGVFPPEIFPFTNLPSEIFYPNLEFWGKINFLKGGIIFSDFLTTVSPTYAQEIQTLEYGFGLDGLLRTQVHKLKGILNGVDYSEWNPETDPYIATPYSAFDLKGKQICKQDLLKICGLPSELIEKPILGMVTRLAEQKGIDILLPVIEKIIQKGAGLVILGDGEKRYEDALKSITACCSEQMFLKIGFDNILAHKIIAGADMFLMPSRYEACGLTQIYSLKYGTLPIVHHTGGLADTVEDADLEKAQGSGFKFYTYTAQAFFEAIEKAIFCFEQKKTIWLKLIQQAMACDFSWEKSAQEYVSVYEEILKNNP